MYDLPAKKCICFVLCFAVMVCSFLFIDATHSFAENDAFLNVKINFQPKEVTVPSGYLADYGELYAKRNGYSYGWTKDHKTFTASRGINADKRLDTLCQFHSKAKWEFAVANGDYNVTVGIGDAKNGSTYTINVEGINYWKNTALKANAFVNNKKLIHVTDGKLTVDQGSLSDGKTRINYIIISDPHIINFDLNDAPQDWGTSSWYPAGGTPPQFTIDKKENSNGKNSLCIHSTDKKGSIGWAKTDVEVEPNTIYTLSGYIKTSNVVSKETGNTGAVLGVVGIWGSRNLTGTTEWTYVQYSFNSGNRSKITLQCSLGDYGSAVTGKAYFNSIKLSKKQLGDKVTYNNLLIVFPNTDTDYIKDGTTLHYKGTLDSGLESTITDAFKNLSSLVPEGSNGLVEFKYDIIEIQDPISKITAFPDGWNWVSPDDISKVLSKYAPENKYDSVHVLWNNGPIDAYWGMGGALIYNNTTTYSCLIPASQDAWTNLGERSGEPFLHEWLHGVSVFYRIRGAVIPDYDADGGTSHGYTKSSTDGWFGYYQDLMQGKVWEPKIGAFAGITRQDWLCCKPTDP